MRFLNSVTVPKNVKRALWDFLTSIVLQKKSKQTKGRPFGGIQKSSKKVAKKVVPKKIRVINTKGSYVFEVLDVDVSDEILAFRVCFGRP